MLLEPASLLKSSEDQPSSRPPRNAYSVDGVGEIRDDGQERAQATLVLAHNLADLAGHHRAAFGLELEQQQLSNLYQFSGGVDYSIYDDLFRGSSRRYAELGDGDGFTDNCAPEGEAPLPCRYLDSLRTCSSSSYAAAFVADTWTPIRDLTLHAGVRSEHQRVQHRLELHDLAPRMGLTYDWTGRGRSRTYASWGRVIEPIPLALNRGAFVPVSSVAHSIDSSGEESVDYLYLGQEHTIADGLRSQFQDDFIVGTEYMLREQWRVGLSYHHRDLGRLIEDVARVENGEVVGFELANPAGKRSYDGVTVTVVSSATSPIVIIASYTYSQLRGNYEGLFQSNGQVAPHTLSAFDRPELESNSYGPLPADRPHYFKLDGYGRLPFKRGEVLLGGRVRALSGQPVSYLGYHNGYGFDEVFVLPRGSAGRLEPTWSCGLRAGYRLPLPNRGSLELFTDIFNQHVASVHDTYTTDPVRPIDGGTEEDLIFLKADESGEPAGRTYYFGEPASRYQPLAARFGLRVTF